jgi:rhodanese-related sulfurtransferase
VLELTAKTKITLSALAQFEPLATLSSSRLQELAELCFVERVSKEISPLRLNMGKTSQLMFLLAGDLGLSFQDGSKRILRAGTTAAKFSIDERRLLLQDALALTAIEVIRIDLELLDIMMTWDQLSRIKPMPKATRKNAETVHLNKAPQENPALKINSKVRTEPSKVSQWMRDTDMFSAEKIRNGIFSRLPTANIQEMFKRMQYVAFNAGQVVVQQGAEGDYYYLLESGDAVMTRITVSQNKPEVMRNLLTGDFFGEEAVVSEGKSNVTVTMQADGAVLRLKKSDFNALLKAPLINKVTQQQAQKEMSLGKAVLVDVRFPSEFKFDAMDGAVNLPLNKLRNLMADLDKTKQYITYCLTGRRSSAAAFILIEHGFDAVVLIS